MILMPLSKKLERIRNSEQRDGINVWSSCLSVVSMALHMCTFYYPINRQLVSYCLLLYREMEDNKRSLTENVGLLEILTKTENSLEVVAMVAATYALLGRTVDIVTHSRSKDFGEFRFFYDILKIPASDNVDEISEGGIRLKQSILYCCDEDKWKFSDNDAYAEEEEKSLDQVLEEMKGEEVGQEEALWMKTIIKNSLTQIDKYKDDFERGIERELKRIQNSEQKDDIDVLSSCLSVVSMALYICKRLLASEHTTSELLFVGFP